MFSETVLCRSEKNDAIKCISKILEVNQGHLVIRLAYTYGGVIVDCKDPIRKCHQRFLVVSVVETGDLNAG